MDEFVIKMANVFKALSDPTRLKIFRLVCTKQNNFYVAEIAEKIGITNSAVSQHLKILKSIGIVNYNRKGFKVYYSANNEMFSTFKENIKKLTDMAIIPCDFDGNCSECPKIKNCTIK